MKSGSKYCLDWVERVACSSRFLSDICLEEESTLKTHLLVQQVQLDRRVTMVLNGNQRAKFGHIFVNYLKIRPVRPTEITDYSTPMETFHLTPYLQKSIEQFSEQWRLNVEGTDGQTDGAFLYTPSILVDEG